MNTTTPVQRERGGCLTAFLVLILIVNPLTALYYLVSGSSVQDTYPDMPDWAIPALIVLGIANFVFGLALWRWKKWGFYGFAASSVAAFIVNMVSGIPIITALFGFVGVALLYYLLRNVWNTME